jgi:lipopolysaccharide export LptBFGC system permease protein LptF
LLALVLMVLAVPLARLRPRQGRFGRVGIAILVYFIYSQLMAAARTWVESTSCPSSSASGGCTRSRCASACGCWRARIRRASRVRWRCQHDLDSQSLCHAQRCSGTTLLVMLVLLTLSGLYIFITQQDEIGVGSYSLEDAFLFVGLNLPKYAFDMLPIAA